MDRNRTVAGLDVHKDSIYLCIMGHDEVIIFEKKYGVLTQNKTPEIKTIETKNQDATGQGGRKRGCRLE